MFENKYSLQWYLSYDKEADEVVYLLQLPLSLYAVVRYKQKFGYEAIIYQKLETGDEVYEREEFTKDSGDNYADAKSWAESYILLFMNQA